MASIIPFVPGDPEQFIAITLDQVPYVLRARWNTRDAAWYLDAWESDGVTVIAYGIKLVLGVFLGQRVRHPLFLSGMFVIDDSGTGIDPGLNDLGGRCSLMHITADERVLATLGPS